LSGSRTAALVQLTVDAKIMYLWTPSFLSQQAEDELEDITAKQRSERKSYLILQFNSEKRVPDVRQDVQVPKKFPKT